MAWSSTSRTIAWYCDGCAGASVSGASGATCGSSGMQLELLCHYIRKPRADFVERQNFTSRVELRRSFRHPVNGAAGPILRNGVMALVVQHSQTLRAVP